MTAVIKSKPVSTKVPVRADGRTETKSSLSDCSIRLEQVDNLAGSRLSSGIIRLPPDNEYIRDRTYIR